MMKFLIRDDENPEKMHEKLDAFMVHTQWIPKEWKEKIATVFMPSDDVITLTIDESVKGEVVLPKTFGNIKNVQAISTEEKELVFIVELIREDLNINLVFHHVDTLIRFSQEK